MSTQNQQDMLSCHIKFDVVNFYVEKKEPYKRDDILQKRLIICIDPTEGVHFYVELSCAHSSQLCGVAIVSRIDTIIGLFCRISSFL